MKSSTLHKPNISKERIAALEELLQDKKISYDSSPGVYVRSENDQELDILWQGFKLNAKDERSPGVYLTIGFITGAICMFLMTTILNFGTPAKDGFMDLNLWKQGNIKSEKVVNPQISVTPSESLNGVEGKGVNTKTEKYVVESGDTLEAIAYKYYGSRNPEKIQLIQTANNMTSPDQIAIGQEINIPVEN